MQLSKELRKKRIHYRIRKKVSGTAARPRLSVARSNKAIYCQLIDDVSATTLAAASSNAADFAGKGATRIEQAALVGKAIAAKAVAAGITNVVFDRGGYLYHGRVKSLADGAREGGLQF